MNGRIGISTAHCQTENGKSLNSTHFVFKRETTQVSTRVLSGDDWSRTICRGKSDSNVLTLVSTTVQKKLKSDINPTWFVPHRHCSPNGVERQNLRTRTRNDGAKTCVRSTVEGRRPTAKGRHGKTYIPPGRGDPPRTRTTTVVVTHAE